MCSLFPVFILFYLILENMSTNVNIRTNIRSRDSLSRSIFVLTRHATFLQIWFFVLFGFLKIDYQVHNCDTENTKIFKPHRAHNLRQSIAMERTQYLKPGLTNGERQFSWHKHFFVWNIDFIVSFIFVFYFLFLDYTNIYTSKN